MVEDIQNYSKNGLLPKNPNITVHQYLEFLLGSGSVSCVYVHENIFTTTGLWLYRYLSLVNSSISIKFQKLNFKRKRLEIDSAVVYQRYLDWNHKNSQHDASEIHTEDRIAESSGISEMLVHEYFKEFAEPKLKNFAGTIIEFMGMVCSCDYMDSVSQEVQYPELEINHQSDDDSAKSNDSHVVDDLGTHSINGKLISLESSPSRCDDVDGIYDDIKFSDSIDNFSDKGNHATPEVAAFTTSTLPSRFATDKYTKSSEKISKNPDEGQSSSVSSFIKQNGINRTDSTKRIRNYSAFVLLSSYLKTCQLLETKIHKNEYSWNVRRAPRPSDIIWDNLHINSKITSHRRFLTRSLLFLVAVLYSAPVFFIQKVVLSRYMKITRSRRLGMPPESDTWLDTQVRWWVPAVLQMGLLITILGMFKITAIRVERYKTYSDVSAKVMVRYFTFYLITVYIVVLGDVVITFRELKNIFSVANSGDIIRCYITRIGHVLPPVSTYFCATMILEITTSIAVYTIQPVPLIASVWDELSDKFFRRKHALENEETRPVLNYTRLTPESSVVAEMKVTYTDGMPSTDGAKHEEGPSTRQTLRNETNPHRKDVAVSTSYLDHSGEVVSYIFGFSLCITFAVMAPFVLLVGFVYFAILRVSCTYRLTYMNTAVYETGGVIWLNMFKAIGLSMVLGQVSLLGAVLAQFPLGDPIVLRCSIALGILPIVSILYCKLVLHTFGGEASQSVSLRDAVLCFAKYNTCGGTDKSTEPRNSAIDEGSSSIRRFIDVYCPLYIRENVRSEK